MRLNKVKLQWMKRERGREKGRKRKRGDFVNGRWRCKKKSFLLWHNKHLHTQADYLHGVIHMFGTGLVGTRAQIRQEWYAKLSQFTTHIQMQCIQSTLTGKVTWIPFAQISSHIHLFKQTRAPRKWISTMTCQMWTWNVDENILHFAWAKVHSTVYLHAVYSTELHRNIASVLFLSP